MIRKEWLQAETSWALAQLAQLSTASPGVTPLKFMLVQRIHAKGRNSTWSYATDFSWVPPGKCLTCRDQSATRRDVLGLQMKARPCTHEKQPHSNSSRIMVKSSSSRKSHLCLTLPVLVGSLWLRHRFLLQSSLPCTSSSAAAACRGTGSNQEGSACQHLDQTASRLIFGFVGREMFDPLTWVLCVVSDTTI